MMAFDIFTIRRLLLWTLHVWNPLSAACRQIGQSAAGRWRWCPDYTENVTPRRRYLHCLLSIDTQDPGLKLLYDGHWTKTQRVKQAWAGLECVECLAPRLPGAVTMDTKILILILIFYLFIIQTHSAEAEWRHCHYHHMLLFQYWVHSGC